jgi:hypothetical protein
MPPAEAGAAVAPRFAPLARRLATVAQASRALPWQPWSVLGPLVLVQWAVVAAFALTVRHNGWLFYQGGDETFYWTTSWSLSNGHLPEAVTGYGWSLLTAPIALVAGSNILTALPALVIIQTTVLTAIALVCVYGIATRIGGRLFGYWAAAAWIATPFVAILFFDPRYHEKYVEFFLPQALGLTNLADFPSTVLLLVAGYLLLRAIEARDSRAAVLAGLVSGFALGVKPANAPFLVGAALALVVARRWRLGGLFAAALVPSLITLILWKARSLGNVPLFALGTHTVAAGTNLAAALPIADVGLHRYVPIDFGRLDTNLVNLREFFWNTRLLELLPFAGMLAIARRSLAAVALIGGWFWAFFLIKGSYQYATIDSGAFFRFLMPGFPAYLLLAASVPLLLPRLRRAASRPAPVVLSTPALRHTRWTLPAAAVVLALVPLIVIAAASKLPAGSAVRVPLDNTYSPVIASMRPSTRIENGTVRIMWRKVPTGGTTVFYRVVRRSENPIVCNPVAGGVTGCQLAADYVMDPTTRTWTTDRPGIGKWYYVVRVLGNWRNDSSIGDTLALSPPVSAEVR